MIKGIWNDAGGNGAVHILAGVPEHDGLALELGGKKVFAVVCMSHDSPGVVMLTREQASEIVEALTLSLEGDDGLAEDR